MLFGVQRRGGRGILLEVRGRRASGPRGSYLSLSRDGEWGLYFRMGLYDCLSSRSVRFFGVGPEELVVLGRLW